MKPDPRRSMLFLLFVAWIMTIFAAPLAAGAQQAVLPPVSLVLTLEVHDQHASLGMQHEILATPQESQRNLFVTTSFGPSLAGS